MIWQPGMKAECIREDWVATPNARGAPRPVKGSVYDVCGVVLGNVTQRVCLHLIGFPPTVCYLAEHFRPVVSTNTDISVFTKILDDASRRQPALVD